MHPLSDTDPVKIGRYRLTGRLGAGGMGTVYLGSTPGGRPVAIKVIGDQFQYEDQALERFRREVGTLHTVRSAYSASLIDCGLDEPPYWFATEYVPGRTLYSAVRTSGPLPPPLCLALLAALAEGLSDIHDHDILHRDVKPQNVILSPVGPQLIDFGIARVAGQSALTQVGHTAGTPGFTAPEAYRGEPTGVAADVFALGATVAFAATGRPPYGDGSFSAVAYRTVHGDIDLGSVEPRLAEILAACTDRDPERRPAPAEIVELCDSHTSLANDPHYRLISVPDPEEAVPGTVAVPTPVPTALDASAADRDAAAPTVHVPALPAAPPAQVPGSLPTAPVPTQVAHGSPFGPPPTTPVPGAQDGGARPGAGRRIALIAAAVVAVGAVVAGGLALLPGSDAEKDARGRAADRANASASAQPADQKKDDGADEADGGDGGEDAKDTSPEAQDPAQNGDEGEAPPEELVIDQPLVLRLGGELVAAKIQLVLQRDGNLVAYDEENKPRWASKTLGAGATAEFQSDGNLVVYDAERKPIWASDTSGHENAVLTLQGDGNITIRDGDSELWATGTGH
ncbi:MULTISPECIES: protein kinase domain-containing protein [Streptomyces]|uniref:Protein kinase n=2 Tax=Streptomyces TaxID=1883 RepID=A0ABD5EI01_9ACTN|nr:MULTISPECIES: protein kinase [unclassified Streptomyces]MDT0433404.1 protein kinase [Streptomyces sp. DSM 41981]MYQ66831.1 protein kinase [Streptomyces sp. SID4950]SCE25937.1 Serine/threonine protein kinase [Streptomyces sp. SolWspMP-5a-2]